MNVEGGGREGKKIRSTVDKLSSGKQESTAFVFFICIDALC